MQDIDQQEYIEQHIYCTRCKEAHPNNLKFFYKTIIDRGDKVSICKENQARDAIFEKIKKSKVRAHRNRFSHIPWASMYDLVIQQIYDLCPEGMTVDHMIPINGVGVCGLPVPWNLCYLTREENSIKNNYYPEDGY